MIAIDPSIMFRSANPDGTAAANPLERAEALFAEILKDESARLPADRYHNFTPPQYLLSLMLLFPLYLTDATPTEPMPTRE